MYKFLFGLLILIICSSETLAAQDLVEDKIKYSAAKLLQDKRFTSVSIGVVYNNKSQSEHLGELTRDQNNTPTDSTIYEIGSVSKTIVGLMIANAELEGKLDINENINVYLDNKLSRVSPANNPITIKQLLTHSSGLQNSNEYRGLAFNELNQQRFIESVNAYSIEDDKGQFRYSSVGTELLCYILEEIEGLPFEEQLTQFLNKNIEMKNTRVNLLPQNFPFFAYGYNTEQEIAKSHTAANKLWGGSGYIKASMQDLMKYMQFQLQNNNKLVQLSQSKLFDITETDGFGYLWILSQDPKLGKYIIHHGGVESTQNWMVIFPNHELAISVVTNSSFPETARILRELVMDLANRLLA
jgi:CubicO group peptidase (beta-lactamase class C family)